MNVLMGHLLSFERCVNVAKWVLIEKRMKKRKYKL